MNHYVCTGDCKTVSDGKRVCDSEFCNKKGENYELCRCEDGEHEEAGQAPEEEEDDSE